MSIIPLSPLSEFLVPVDHFLLPAVLGRVEREEADECFRVRWPALPVLRWRATTSATSPGKYRFVLWRDRHLLRFWDLTTVSLTTLAGRVKMSMVMGTYQADQFGNVKLFAELVRRKDGKWFLNPDARALGFAAEDDGLVAALRARAISCISHG